MATDDQHASLFWARRDDDTVACSRDAMSPVTMIEAAIAAYSSVDAKRCL